MANTEITLTQQYNQLSETALSAIVDFIKILPKRCFLEISPLTERFDQSTGYFTQSFVDATLTIEKIIDDGLHEQLLNTIEFHEELTLLNFIDESKTPYQYLITDFEGQNLCALADFLNNLKSKFNENDR